MLFCVIVGETSTNGLEMSLCHLKLNSGSHKILLNTGCPIPRVQRSAHNGTDQLIQTHIDAVRMIAPSVLLFLQTNVPQFGCMTLCVFCIDIYYSPCDRGKTWSYFESMSKITTCSPNEFFAKRKSVKNWAAFIRDQETRFMFLYQDHALLCSVYPYIAFMEHTQVNNTQVPKYL